MSRHTVGTCRYAPGPASCVATFPHIWELRLMSVTSYWVWTLHSIDTPTLLPLPESVHWMVVACWQMALSNMSDYNNTKKRTGTKAIAYIILALILSIQMVLFSYESFLLICGKKIMRWAVKPALLNAKWERQGGFIQALCECSQTSSLTVSSLWLPDSLFILVEKITPVSIEQIETVQLLIAINTVAIVLKERSQSYSFQPGFSAESRKMLPLYNQWHL